MQTTQNHNASSNDNSPHGGKAAIGLFGVTSVREPRNAQPPLIPSQPARSHGDDRARTINGLTFSQRRACIRALVSQPLPPRLVQPPVIRLRVGNFAAFVRLAERERRPVSEVIAEWLTDCGRLIGRDELLEDAPLATTPAMHRAARAADERERCGCVDDECAEYTHRCAGTGYVEITLVTEG